MDFIVKPISIISSTEKRSPRAKLQATQAGRTLPLMCPRELLIRSRPINLSVVPQYEQGREVISAISKLVRSHESVLSYAFLKEQARPLIVLLYFACVAFLRSFCSGVKSDHLSLRLSRPFFRTEWQRLHSYDNPSVRELSLMKWIVVAGSSVLHLLHTLCPSFLALLYALIKKIYHLQGEESTRKDGPHFQL